MAAENPGPAATGTGADINRRVEQSLYARPPSKSQYLNGTASYSPCSIKRVRRTKAEVEALRKAIHDILAVDHPATVRQIYYALVVRGLIKKTEAQYNGTVVRLLTLMRRDSTIPYSWISDNTRWMRKPTTYRGLRDFLWRNARFYRRDLWADADCYVEIWCEKDALAGVILEETKEFDVPLMVSRGFSSDTYLQSAAEAIETAGKPTYIYQFGDHDPSGIWIAKQIESGLRRHTPNAEIHFERVAVTPDQITQWSLPTRPTKREGNTHARRFKGESVELDAIPAAQLRALVRNCIEQHLDSTRIAQLKVTEDSERGFLRGWEAALGNRTSAP